MPRLIPIIALPVDEGPKALPLGALCVASAMNAEARAGIFSELSLPLPGEEAETFARRVLSLSGGIAGAGFSLYSWNRPYLVRAARAMRSLEPGLFLFAGGPDATADPEGILGSGPFDLVVSGEGESAAARIALALSDAAASLRAGGEARAFPGEKLLASLEGPGLYRKGFPAPALPRGREALSVSPWLDGTVAAFKASLPEGPGGRGKAFAGALWELARGCPYACSYCYESKGERKPRFKPLELARRELEAIRDSGAKAVYVLDPTFNADKARASELLRMMARVAGGLRYEFEVRAELLDEGLAKLFAALDCSLQVGLQSSDPGVSARAGRPLDAERFKRGLASLDRHGVRYGIDLIYGLPGDAPALFRRSLDFALGLGPNHLDIFRLAVLPGTALRDAAGAEGLVYRAEAPYLLRSTPSFGEAELDAAETLAFACAAFYERGRAVAWFMPLCRALRARPHEVLERAAGMLRDAGPAARGEAEDPGGRAIEAFQLALVEGLCAGAGRAKLFPAARDLIRYNAALLRAVLDGIPGEAELRCPPEVLEGPLALDLGALAAWIERAGPGPYRLGFDRRGPRV